jgi:hypothetical protein
VRTNPFPPSEGLGDGWRSSTSRRDARRAKLTRFGLNRDRTETRHPTGPRPDTQTVRNPRDHSSTEEIRSGVLSWGLEYVGSRVEEWDEVVLCRIGDEWAVRVVCGGAAAHSPLDGHGYLKSSPTTRPSEVGRADTASQPKTAVFRFGCRSTRNGNFRCLERGFAGHRSPFSPGGLGLNPAAAGSTDGAERATIALARLNRGPIIRNSVMRRQSEH